MSELFSSTRLIDYFLVINTEILSIQLHDSIISKYPLKLNNFTNSNLTTTNNTVITQYDRYKVECKYKIKDKFPEKDYKNTYEMNIDSIFKMINNEYCYHIPEINQRKLKKPIKKNSQLGNPIEESSQINYLFDYFSSKFPVFSKFFSMCFTNYNGSYYYGHFLRVYEEEYCSLLNLYILIPKYLIFFSENPFFISFKSLLEEIYINSITNHGICFKTEQLLSIVLFKSFLPKYEATQMSFSINSKNYTFTRNILHNEVSLKVLFTFLTVDNIVLLFLSLLMNSKVLIFYSQIEIICPIIQSLITILFPFSLGYNIINSLHPTMIDILESPSSNIIIGINKLDFSKDEIDEVYHKIKNNLTDIVYCELDTNYVNINYNEDMRIPDMIPINYVTKLINNLINITSSSANQNSYSYDSEIVTYLKETNQDLFLFDDLLKEKEKENGKNLSFWEYASSFKFKDLNEVVSKSKSNISSHFSNKKLIHVSQQGSSASNNRKNTLKSINYCKIYNKLNNCESIESEIKGFFLNFIINLFESYDEDKHYDVDNSIQNKKQEKQISNQLQNLTFDKIFNPIRFIEDSKKDIQSFLKKNYRNFTFDFFIQNLNFVVDKLYKEDLIKSKIISKYIMPKCIREGALVDHFYSQQYILFKKCIDSRNKDINKLIRNHELIFHTITIPSPEIKKRLPYFQQSIFLDPIIKEDLILTSCLGYSLYEDTSLFTNPIIDIRNQNSFNRSLLINDITAYCSSNEDVKEVKQMENIEEKDEINLKSNSNSKIEVKKLNQGKNIFVKSTLNSDNLKINKENNSRKTLNEVLNNENFTLSLQNVPLTSSKVKKKSLTNEFKKLMFSNIELFKKFYRFNCNITNIISNDSIQETQISNISNRDNFNSNKVTSIKSSTIISNTTFLVNTLKVNFIKNYSSLTNLKSQNSTCSHSFYINLSLNTIQTCSYCSNCKKIHSLWEVRNLINTNNKVDCAYCNNLFTPNIICIENLYSEEDEDQNIINEYIIIYKKIDVLQMTTLTNLLISTSQQMNNKSTSSAFKLNNVNSSIDLFKGKYNFGVFYNILTLLNEFKVIVNVSHSKNNSFCISAQNIIQFIESFHKIPKNEMQTSTSFLKTSDFNQNRKRSNTLNKEYSTNKVINLMNISSFPISSKNSKDISKQNSNSINNNERQNSFEPRREKNIKKEIDINVYSKDIFNSKSKNKNIIHFKNYSNSNEFVVKLDYKTLASEEKYDLLSNEIDSLPQNLKQNVIDSLSEMYLIENENKSYIKYKNKFYDKKLENLEILAAKKQKVDDNENNIHMNLQKYDHNHASSISNNNIISKKQEIQSILKNPEKDLKSYFKIITELNDNKKEKKDKSFTNNINLLNTTMNSSNTNNLKEKSRSEKNKININETNQINQNKIKQSQKALGSNERVLFRSDYDNEISIKEEKEEEEFYHKRKGEKLKSHFQQNIEEMINFKNRKIIKPSVNMNIKNNMNSVKYNDTTSNLSQDKIKKRK